MKLRKRKRFVGMMLLMVLSLVFMVQPVMANTYSLGKIAIGNQTVNTIKVNDVVYVPLEDVSKGLNILYSQNGMTGTLILAGGELATVTVGQTVGHTGLVAKRFSGEIFVPIQFVEEEYALKIIEDSNGCYLIPNALIAMAR